MVYYFKDILTWVFIRDCYSGHVHFCSLTLTKPKSSNYAVHIFLQCLVEKQGYYVSLFCLFADP